MRYLVLLALPYALPFTLGCSTEPLVCATILHTETAYLANSTGQPLAGISVTDTVRRTGAVLHLSAGLDTLPADSTRVIPVFPDTLSAELAPRGDDVVVVVTADNHVTSGVYRFFFNGCSVERLAGPDTLILR
jgi:hypothetical protein